eukprot:18750-Heterococcus_DN1.PRE.2
MVQAGVRPNHVTICTLIDSLQKADQIHAGDELYRQAMSAKLVCHWYDSAVDRLNLTCYSSSMASAAIRLVLHNMKAASNGATAVIHNDKRVHDVYRDLHIITGYGVQSAAQNSNVLQPSVADMLAQLGLKSNASTENKDILIVPSQQLVAYCSRDLQD